MQKSLIKKENIYTILIVLLLLTSFFLSLSRLEPPHTHTSRRGDSTRDYLVAHYITSYGERPLVGPLVGYQGGKRNSPLYFYLLAGFLKIKDSVFFLGVVNIFFHITTVFLIYLIAKTLFSPLKALLSSLFFSLIPEVFRQTEFVWQPYQMQPFAYLALFLLIISYQKNNFKIALFSLVMLCFAGTLHISAFAWLPLFLIAIFLIIGRKERKVKLFLISCLTIILSITVFYLPVLVYYLKNSHILKYLESGSTYFVPSIQNFVSNLSYKFFQVMKVFSLKLDNSLQIDQLIAATLIMVSLIYYFFTQNMKAKATVFLGFLLFMSPIVGSSLFIGNPRYQLHHLFLTFGIFAILIVEVVISSSSKISKFWPFKFRLLTQLIIIILLFNTFSSNFNFPLSKRHHDKLSPTTNAISAVKQEILNIKKEQNFLYPNFFQVISFSHNYPYVFSYHPPLDTIFLIPLEKNLQTKLAKTSDNNPPWNLTQTNDDSFIFLVCVEFYNKRFIEDCTGSFSQSYPNHKVIKKIYTQYPVGIYLTKRHSI